MQQPHILQALANIEEAKHASIFVAGWRPALGWLSAICLGYAWIIKDIMVMTITVAIDKVRAEELLVLMPKVETGDLMTLITLLLGLGGIRAYEAVKGVKRDKL